MPPTKTVDPYVKRLLEERSTHVAVIQGIQKRAADEERDTTDDERATLEQRAERIKSLDADLQFNADIVTANSKFTSLVGAREEAEERAERAHDDAETETRETKTETTAALEVRAGFGKRFIDSPEFKGYTGSGSSGRVELPGPASEEFRAAITLGDFAELPSQFWSGPAGFVTTTPLLDRLGRVATSQAAVQYLYWGTADPVAQEVAEGAVKPEADLAPDVRAANLVTYAHWKAITRQALEDIAQIQSIVQNKLLRGVGNALEKAAAATLAAATDIPSASGGDLTTAIRMGLATIETDGYTANAVVANPADAAQLDLDQLGNTNNGAVRNSGVWGLPIVSASAVPEGTAYVGDFSQGITWFDRGTTDVYMSDSHADNFIRNVLVVLAEARAAFAVTEPAALVKVSTGAGGGSAPAARSARKA